MVTSRLLKAFLACPVKCHLLSKGEVPAGTEYPAWAAAREESCRREGVRRLTSQETGPSIAAAEPGLWKHESWRFAVGKTVRAEGWEAEIALIQRIPLTGAPSRFVPIRFAATNKLSASDKTMAAFEAIALAKALGTKTGTVKIVHGEKSTMVSVNAAALSRAVHRKISQVASLLSTVSPPDTVVHRHCPECGFHDRCRKDAVGKDELSLLSNLTGKERAKYRCKGIFTVSQLAYTFRPRRRTKRLAERPERYRHALKALAIRERKIHIVGNPELPMDGTEHRSLWADSPADEKCVWEEFLGILSEADRPTLLHYGSFEKTFLKKMCERYGGPPEPSAAAAAIASATSLLAVIYARIYFPTYSNGLKEIARSLRFEWSERSASGLLSISWRSRWEESRDTSLRDRLIAYNADDCEALSLVARTIVRLLSPEVPVGERGGVSEVVHAEELGRNRIGCMRRACLTGVASWDLRCLLNVPIRLRLLNQGAKAMSVTRTFSRISCIKCPRRLNFDPRE